MVMFLFALIERRVQQADDEGMEMEDALVSPFGDISRLAAERAVQIGPLQTKGLLPLHRGPETNLGSSGHLANEGMEMEDSLVSPFGEISRLAAERAVQIGTLQTKGLLPHHRGPMASKSPASLTEMDGSSEGGNTTTR
ncbi:hypothetical protein HPB47_001625 [Ixodes persulcatus]|uniref:Uncharacterized protein n=1 Tax=Ixodes persulcatus TaxID=34615 RepID=A0AC60PNH4_IXOPE|nr:hypothetical protein HPB47_001625 [Ixodes persulcatus]